MTPSHRRHDISDKVWALPEPHLPGQSGQWGGVAKDNRLFINAVFWIMRTGAPWRDFPPLIMAAGVTRIAALSVGVTRVCASIYCKFSLMSLITNG